MTALFIVLTIFFTCRLLLIMVSRPDGKRSIGSDLRDMRFYDIDITPRKVKAGSGEKRTMPDYSLLDGILSESQRNRVVENIEKIMRKHGGDGILVIDKATLAMCDYLKKHPCLLPGDEVVLDVVHAYKCEEFMSVECFNAASGVSITHLHIEKKEKAYGLLENIKITGSYIGDVHLCSDEDFNRKFPPKNSKIIVFFEDRKDGDDDDVMTPEDTAGLLCFLGEWIKHSNRVKA